MRGRDDGGRVRGRSLWQWRIRADEPGFHRYFLAEGAGWQGALDFEGSRYVGLVGQILAGLPTANLQPSWDLCLTTRGLVDPGVLFLGYAEHGGRWDIRDAEGHVPAPYWLLDPRTGSVVASGRLGARRRGDRGRQQPSREC